MEWTFPGKKKPSARTYASVKSLDVLPQKIRVKLSSEAAGAISLTPVVSRDLAIADLLEEVLAVTGKDEPRIRDILQRGTLVTGASRYRWQGWEPDAESLREALAGFPDPDPARPFSPAQCVQAALRGGRQTVELARETAAHHGLFRRTSFWDVLMRLLAADPPPYSGYSYRDRADRYRRELAAAERDQLRSAARLLRYSSLRQRIEAEGFTEVELTVPR
jgi:hypothetical protein